MIPCKQATPWCVTPCKDEIMLRSFPSRTLVDLNCDFVNCVINCSPLTNIKYYILLGSIWDCSTPFFSSSASNFTSQTGITLQTVSEEKMKLSLESQRQLFYGASKDVL